MTEPNGPTWDDVATRLDVVLSGALYEDGALAPVVRVAVLPRLYLYPFIEGDPPSLVPATEAGRWERTHAEIVASALARRVDLEITLEPIEDGPISLVMPADGAAVWLVMPGFLRSLRQDLGAQVVCAIPTASTCLLARADDPRVVALLYELALDVFGRAEAPLSPELYALNEETGLVAPLAPPESEPDLVAAAARAERELDRRAYVEQKASLAAAFEANGVDVLLGDLAVVELPEVGWTTTTVLWDDPEALLPVAEHLFVAYEGPAGPRRMLVRREDVERVAPGLFFTSPDHDPPRMTVVRSLDDAEIEALWEVATLKEEGLVPGEDDPPEPAPTPPG